MRADRLISLLMLLQARGRMTAPALARELEVSERTIYRDIDALSASGVPVYADRGPDGGFALLDSYRTDLTGLTEGELRALFLLSIPRALADLGLDELMAAALRKLLAAVPASRRGELARIRQRFYIDPLPWRSAAADTPSPGAPSATAPLLAVLQQAVWEDRRAVVAYRLPSGPRIEVSIEVYGLVTKEGAWYVLHVREERVQALRIAELLDARPAAEHFVRRPHFDLAAAWDAWCTGGAQRPLFEMLLAVAPSFVASLGHHGFTVLACDDGRLDDEGRVCIRAGCESFEVARGRVLALGRAVEVLAPEPLRCSIIDYAEQIRLRYAALALADPATESA